MAANLYCRHHQYGHCKYGLQCRKQHSAETCENFPCTVNSCSKRHPKVCRYFLFTGHCKFNENCSFLHKHDPQSPPDNLEKKIEKLREDIESLTTEIKRMKQILDSVSIISDPEAPNTSKSSSVSISQISHPLQDAQAQHNSQENLQCETCHKVFKSSYDFKKHDEMQFCCDDCNICYSTQLEADLHALEVHPDETYARNFIPEATKLIFAQQNPNTQP